VPRTAPDSLGGDPLKASSYAGPDVRPNIPNQPPAQVQNPGAVAIARCELRLEFLHECAGGIRIHAELVQTFAEIGDVGGVCYSLKRLFANAKAAHSVFVELREEAASSDRAPS
jgi:hypothetical protein